MRVDTVVQTLEMLVDFWRTKNFVEWFMMFFNVFFSLATFQVLGSQFQNTENHLVFLKMEPRELANSNI